MRVTFISDTHGLHDFMSSPLPKSDVLIHSGDCTNVGKEDEIIEFLNWFNGLEGYKHKIFIAGNHDFGFENNRMRHMGELPYLERLVEEGKLPKLNCVYLEDSEYVINSDEFSKPIKIYGSPWQPEFYNWAFNLPRNGVELQEKWDLIPVDTNILITHGPAYGHLDISPRGHIRVGCELLTMRINEIKPLIHSFGHIHHSRGIKETSDTLYINSCICNERYKPKNPPITINIEEVYGDLVISEINEK
jgi:predicted phosphodiesterase